MKEGGILGSWLLGILLSLSVYLYFAAGDGIVSLHASNPSFLISLAAIPLVFLSPNLENHITDAAIVFGFLICLVGGLLIIGSTIVVGFPNSDWAPASSAVPIFPAFLAFYYVVRNFRLVPHILIGFLLSFPATILMVKDYESRRIDRQIQRTINSGGCVWLKAHRYSGSKSEPKTIETVSEIPLGIFIGHNSPRIYFTTKHGTQDWSYSKSEAQMYWGTPMPCLNDAP